MELKDGLYKIKRGDQHILVELESINRKEMHMTCLKTGNSDTFLKQVIVDYFESSETDRLERADYPLVNYTCNRLLLK